MQTQTSFAELEYISKKKLTRRERFLAQIEAATPWAQLVAVIEPHYPKGEREPPPIGLERMLRMYIAQKDVGLSDESIEDALYDSQAIWQGLGARGRAREATTLQQVRWHVTMLRTRTGRSRSSACPTWAGARWSWIPHSSQVPLIHQGRGRRAGGSYSAVPWAFAASPFMPHISAHLEESNHEKSSALNSYLPSCWPCWRGAGTR
jgi:hypothetical protein